MKQKLSLSLVFIVLGMFIFAAIPAMSFAETGKGYYYAMPSWNMTMDSDERFVILRNMNREAVMDKETGLVWERSPSTDTMSWNGAHSHCNNLVKGNRMGWRVPSLHELQSLIDPTQSNPALPEDHPFNNVQSDNYWSATTSHFTDNAMVLHLGAFGVGHGGMSVSGTIRVWCVRGGQGVDSVTW